MYRAILFTFGLLGCGTQGELQQPNTPPAWYLQEDEIDMSAQASQKNAGAEDVETDEKSPEQAKTDEAKTDEAKTDEAKAGEAKGEKVKGDEASGESQ